jgi:hypothetical protein
MTNEKNKTNERISLWNLFVIGLCRDNRMLAPLKCECMAGVCLHLVKGVTLFFYFARHFRVYKNEFATRLVLSGPNYTYATLNAPTSTNFTSVWGRPEDASCLEAQHA